MSQKCLTMLFVSVYYMLVAQRILIKEIMSALYSFVWGNFSIDKIYKFKISTKVLSSRGLFRHRKIDVEKQTSSRSAVQNLGNVYPRG